MEKKNERELLHDEITELRRKRKSLREQTAEITTKIRTIKKKLGGVSNAVPKMQ